MRTIHIRNNVLIAQSGFECYIRLSRIRGGIPRDGLQEPGRRPRERFR